MTKISTHNEFVINKLTSDISDHIVNTSRNILKTEDINFTGGLSDKIKQYMSGKFSYINFDSPYAQFVNDGMPPGEDVDITRLREWVRKKVGISDEEVLSIVTGRIYKKITNEGIPPTRFLDKAVDVVINIWGKKKRKQFIRTKGRLPAKKTIKILKSVTKAINKINKLVNR